ncbi:MAG: GAF domain-containing protein [Ferruginibacter sp.]|nr:GAF domain-containing protein [Cytophagales bacterium]
MQHTLVPGYPLSREEERVIFRSIHRRADRFSDYFLVGYFLFGLFLASFHATWLMALGAGGGYLLAVYAVRYQWPSHTRYQYLLSAVYALFTAQFIYQMPGLFEMHFFAFIGAVALIPYQNWRLMLPLSLVVFLRDSVFAYLQHTGEIDFTQPGPAVLQAFFFRVGLTGIIIFTSGLWAFDLRKKTLVNGINTVRLEKQLISVEHNRAFAEEISRGNLRTAYPAGETDELGQALVAMQQNLLKAAEREQQEKFFNVGLTAVGEILRDNGDNLADLSERVIAKVVNYLGANQGAIFVLQGEANRDPHLELMACYAFDRKKHLSKRIEVGEGLVGQAFREGDPLHLTNIPADYVAITSGLGRANPASILLVPLKVNDQPVGVIELASFGSFLPHQITFLEKLGESIAATISGARVSGRTRLLLEESQAMTEALRSQEEEIRQNLEELAATQEEMARTTAEMQGQLSAIDASMCTAEFDLTGNVLKVNRKFVDLLEYTEEEVRGRHHRTFLREQERQSEAYRHFWDDLAAGVQQPGDFVCLTKSGRPVWLRAVYSPMFDHYGKAHKVLKIASDITQQKALDDELKVRVEQMQVQEKALHQSVDALTVTQQELLRRQDELRLKDQEMQELMVEMRVNEEDMQRSEERIRKLMLESQIQMKEKNRHVQELEAELERLKRSS